jgi:hypothetical protein
MVLNFCCLVVEKITVKFKLAPLKLSTNFENPDSNPFPAKNVDFDPENAYRKTPVIL